MAAGGQSQWQPSGQADRDVEEKWTRGDRALAEMAEQEALTDSETGPGKVRVMAGNQLLDASLTYTASRPVASSMCC